MFLSLELDVVHLDIPLQLVRSLELAIYIQIELHVPFSVLLQYFHGQFLPVCLQQLVFPLHIDNLDLDLGELLPEALKELQSMDVQTEHDNAFDGVHVEEFQQLEVLSLIPEGHKNVVHE